MCVCVLADEALRYDTHASCMSLFSNTQHLERRYREETYTKSLLCKVLPLKKVSSWERLLLLYWKAFNLRLREASFEWTSDLSLDSCSISSLYRCSCSSSLFVTHEVNQLVKPSGSSFSPFANCFKMIAYSAYLLHSSRASMRISPWFARTSSLKESSLPSSSPSSLLSGCASALLSCSSLSSTVSSRRRSSIATVYLSEFLIGLASLEQPLLCISVSADFRLGGGWRSTNERRKRRAREREEREGGEGGGKERLRTKNKAKERRLLACRTKGSLFSRSVRHESQGHQPSGGERNVLKERRPYASKKEPQPRAAPFREDD